MREWVMLDSLYIGAAGMHAQQVSVDSIANNLANLNTTAFKKNRVSFEDLVYRELLVQNGPVGEETNVLRVGTGSVVSSNEKVFLSGDLKKTDNPLDVAIRGQGFLEVAMPDGSVAYSRAYSRAGTLQVTADGLLAGASGLPLVPNIQVPPDAQDLLVDSTGHVSAKVPGEQAMVELGQIELVNFQNPAALNAIGENLYAATERAGPPNSGKPGDDGYGTLAQGYLEGSNVKLVEEMVNLVLAQRTYELNAKIVQAADEMLAISNNLRR